MWVLHLPLSLYHSRILDAEMDHRQGGVGAAKFGIEFDCALQGSDRRQPCPLGLERK